MPKLVILAHACREAGRQKLLRISFCKGGGKQARKTDKRGGKQARKKLCCVHTFQEVWEWGGIKFDSAAAAAAARGESEFFDDMRAAKIKKELFCGQKGHAKNVTALSDSSC